MTGTKTLQAGSSTEFSRKQAVGELDHSMNAMLLLHAACQGILEAKIKEVNSSWYGELKKELEKAQALVVDWRQNGFLDFRRNVLGEVVTFGEEFLSSKQELNPLFKELENNFSDATKAKILSKLTGFQPQVQKLSQEIEAYQTKLRVFEINMQVPHSQMNTTIGKVQAQEQGIQSQINAINGHINGLRNQIQTDRNAISKAQKAKTSGIVETIFGILLAPVTGGASLILAGIGVSSITEAESKVSSMESQIRKYQSAIVNDQNNLNNDQRTVATLHGLSMSTGIAINDMNIINGALDSLKVTWGIMGSEFSGVAKKLNNATNAQAVIVINAWYLAACNEWEVILKEAKDLEQRAVSSTNKTTIG